MLTNIVLEAIRTRRGLKWGVPVMMLAMPYLLVASICTNLIDQGAPGWLHLLVLVSVCVERAEVVSVGPISLILLARRTSG